MSQPKTLDQYLAEEKTLLDIIGKTGVPDDEAAIYKQTLETVQSEIRRLRAAYSQPAQMGAADRFQGENLESNPNSRLSREALRRPIASATFAQPAGAPPVVSATLSSGALTVIIDWGAGKQDELTEGTARSRFVTALRDLAESRAVRINRFEALPGYITFSRAVAYYRALGEFWGANPSATQLEISVAGAKRRIFDMIQRKACTS